MPLISIIFLAFIRVAHAQVNIPGSPAPTPAANPGAVVGQVYQFALLIGGLLAFGAIVYGGIKYTVSAGNPSAKSDGREWITGALWGLLLLLGSYLILHTINPNLTNLNLPTLEKLQPPPAAPAGGAGGGVYLEGDQARAQLKAAHIDVSGGLATSLEGIRLDTITEVINMKQQNCPTCDIVVTGGTEQTGGHNEGQLSHANGYKVDLRDTSSLHKYITDNAGSSADKIFLPLGKRSDGALQFKNNKTGAIYAYEINAQHVHWDVLVNTGGASGSY